MTKWENYVGYNSVPMVGNQNSPPGPVDNSQLFTSKTMECYVLCVIIVFLSGSYVDTLRDGLNEGVNFGHFPQSAWDILVARYGLSQGSRPIER